MTNLNGQTAIIFGGETGIGKAAAISLARRGASVLIAGINIEAGATAQAEMKQDGLQVTFAEVDVRRPETIAAAVNAAKAISGRLEVMVYAAGVYDGYTLALQATEEFWDQVMDINLKGCFRACQQVLPIMVEQQYGRIVAVASVSSHIGMANGIAYTTSKGGLLSMTRHIGTTFADKGVTMNAVSPGIIETEIKANSARILGELAPKTPGGFFKSPEGYKDYVPAKRRGKAAEVGELIAFLAGPDAGYITAESVLIDGGWASA